MSDSKHRSDEIFQGVSMDDEIQPAYQDQLRQKMLQAFKQSQHASTRHGVAGMFLRPGRRSLKLGLAIAAGLLLVAMGWYAARPAAPSVSFSEVVKRVQDMDAVQYHQTITVATSDQPARTVSAEVINVDAPQWQVIKPDGQVLRAQPIDAPPAQSVLPIAGSAPANTLACQPAQDPFQSWNVIDQLLALACGSAAPAHNSQMIDDHLAVSFCLDHDQKATRIWVDPQTRLPIRVEQVAANETSHVTASNLKWYPKNGQRTVISPPFMSFGQERETLVGPARSNSDNMPMAPTGGNIDSIPMMPIPPGCKILIPGTPTTKPRQTTTAPGPK